MRTTNRSNRLLQGAFAWACVWIVGAIGLTGCDKDGPEPPKPGRICTWDVPAGEKYTFEEAPGNLAPVDFIARVYEGTQDLDCKTYDDRPHPLVIVAHGRIALEVPNNYKGLTYLTNHLASWGDIVVSVNLDVVNALQDEEAQWGIPHRGELILHAIEYMFKQNRTPGSPYFQRIDTTKIALVGHSRGGGGVIYAANYNHTHRNRPIKALATLTPASFGTEPLQAPVPHICLYGSWDGDLYGGEGPNIWSQGTRRAPRELVEIYGANHYFFTDYVNYAPEKAGITRGDHHLLANGMVNAWFDRYLRGLDRYDWGEYLLGTKRLGPKLEYYVSFQESDFVSLYDDPGTSLAKALPPGLGGVDEPDGASSIISSSSIKSLPVSTSIRPLSTCDFAPVDMQAAPDYCFGKAVKASWDERSDGIAFHFEPLDARKWRCLSFRASQVHGDTLNEVDHRKDFRVEILDAQGGRARVSVAAYEKGLQYPDLSGSLPLNDVNNRKQIMRGFRIPKTDFKGVDFSQVTQISILFDRPQNKGFDNRSGAIKVTDLEFSN